jgi:predicted RNA-binding Zn ribbon-like protein
MNISQAEKHAQIITDYLKGKSWVSMSEVAMHLRKMSNDSMTLRIASRRVQEAKRHTMRADNLGAVIIASDDIAAGKMGYKIAESPEEIEAYCKRFEKKILAFQENFENLKVHQNRLLKRMQASVLI